ncbi:MAG: peptidoglycan DD-metalloendopeptidase family protein [Syntrophobacterales bacterium]|jgi:murein DD-endopeptidase MepM/ murein hydrolase activator NlpD
MWRRKRRNLYVEPKQRSRLRLFAVLSFILASLVAVVLCVVPGQQPSSTVSQVSVYPDRFAEKKNYRQRVFKVSQRIKPGDSLYQVLVNHEVQRGEVGALVAACKSLPELQRLKVGEHLELYFMRDSHRLEKVRYEDMNGQVLVISQAPQGWITSRYTKPLLVTHALARGIISDSLYQSALDENIDFSLAMDLADIFAWDIDFFVDLRPGDHYAFLYEQQFRDGNRIGNGRIMAAQFHNDGTDHRAYYFNLPGKGGDYYDEKGRSLRKQFLKSPLRYSRISSGFSKRRLHPILKIYRPHPGIDYAAPTGTPVVAVGDGRVISRRWKNGYGRYIAIRHNSTYITTYGHLSRYASKVKKGSVVKQGQVIGYVGATGHATGPHLDFRMKKHGRFVNPLKQRFPAARPVPRDHLATFQQRVAYLTDKLDQAVVQSEEAGRPVTLAIVPERE